MRRKRVPGPRFVLPKKERSSFDICCKIGEEIGVPFPFAKDEHYTVEDLNEKWVVKVGHAYIGRRHAKMTARKGRHPGGAGERFSETVSAKQQRTKRANRRQRREQTEAHYLAWFQERYKGT
jgi:hypothetical protein